MVKSAMKRFMNNLSGLLRCWEAYSREATTENWLLKLASFHKISGDSFHKKDIGDNFLYEEEEATENRQRKAGIQLLDSGNKRVLAALSNSMAKGIPSLARASLVTIACMRCFLNEFS
ncbi:hypothetical protein HRI_003082700 [Hibiscus trionum]|uniref:Putative E3 ubiquitin-protein ligase LIN ARM-like domain-containing protein n=1 Tax=Hibiscus trionum TaxID=183268 RepID=A0A9W7IDP8_HIBTR|nr:hypothetical protein HRI_003082700 [Hibiscus trionum]